MKGYKVLRDLEKDQGILNKIVAVGSPEPNSFENYVFVTKRRDLSLRYSVESNYILEKGIKTKILFLGFISSSIFERLKKEYSDVLEANIGGGNLMKLIPRNQINRNFVQEEDIIVGRLDDMLMGIESPYWVSPRIKEIYLK